MTVLTASSGTVSLTSATGWSPAQVPAAGDDLAIGAATLLLDRDMVGVNALNTVNFNNASSRVAISGTTRSVDAINGWGVIGNITTTLCTTLISAGMEIVLGGRWYFGSSAGSTTFSIAQGSGGNLTLKPFSGLNSDLLLQSGGAYSMNCQLVRLWTAGIIRTVGRLDLALTNANYIAVAAQGGEWVHDSSGWNYFGEGSSTGNVATLTGSAKMSWTGSLDSGVIHGGGAITHSSTSTQSTLGANGDEFISRGSSNLVNSSLLRCTAGAVECLGVFESIGRSSTLVVAGGTVRYRNQSRAIRSGRSFIAQLIGGTLDVSGLVLANSGAVIVTESGAGSLTANSQTLVTNQSTAAQSASNSAALSGRIITLESDPPTLPGREYVSPEAGTWGYTEAPQTGTGLVIDPAVLAAAMAHLPTLEEIQENAVFVLPISYQQQSQLQGAWIRRAIGDASPMELRALKDANGAAINLSGKTLKLYVTTSGKTPTVVQTFNHADLTVFGDNDSVRFTPSTTLVGTVRKLLLSLRVVTTTEQEIVPGGIDIYRTAWTS